MEKVWFSDPYNFHKEIAEVGHLFVTWRHSTISMRKIDPNAFADLYWGTASGWEAIVIAEEGCVHLDHEHNMQNPKAVYPCWRYGEEWDLLMEMVQLPWGEDEELCSDTKLSPHQRPVLGQEHVVFITDLPTASSGVGRAIVRNLVELQGDFPNCTLFLTDKNSYRIMFGMNFNACNVHPREAAMGGRVTLPHGKEVPVNKLSSHQQWIHLLGMDIPTVKKSGPHRVMYNIRSALWAAEHFKEDIAFKTQQGVPPNSFVATSELQVRQNYSPGRAQFIGDKVACDVCSLASTCKYFREGAVCTLPSSEVSDLAKKMGSRNADTIIAGLSELLQMQTTRVENAVRTEEILGDIDPDVSKMIDSLMQNGIKLAKVLNPALAGGTKVQVNVGGAGAVFAGASPNVITAQIMKAIEETGVERDKITPEMVETYLAQMGAQPEPVPQPPRIVRGEIE